MKFRRASKWWDNCCGGEVETLGSAKPRCRGSIPLRSSRMDKYVEEENPPETTKVVVGVIFDDARRSVLVGERSKGKPFPGKWELIGGKVEKDETLENAIEREAFEETGLGVVPLSLLGELKFEAEGSLFDVTFFECEIKHGGHGDIIMDSKEHSSFRWVKMEDLVGLDWVGENGKFAKWLVEFNRIRQPISADPEK